jgi:acetyl esterase/lipase
MTEIVIWGLDDAATAAALFAHTDSQVTGLVLLNPWVREADSSRTTLFPHLRARFGELGFWRKIAGATARDGAGAAAMSEHVRDNLRAIARDTELPLQQRIVASLSCFSGHTLVVLAGADPLAHEFSDLLDKHDTRCRRVTIAGANHSFASREWRDEVAEASANWIMSW